ncbi:transglycosylase SLT domain-containing protein [Stappia sp. F7233]|uniref:Transglycosylase SLT domain-containing protein n=1 Tax=Stappia albiluteola TaxID=2758565 RepID=A0A839AH09_9HYPH|nr:transglycosylase SLT domain-containing protein [Stappia albiluteola]MBA5777819.1 transglycosylase SLT domain-containing protein [Stappia albiluteola]
MQTRRRAGVAAAMIVLGLSMAACQSAQIATTTVNPAILEGGRAAMYDDIITTTAKKHGIPAELAHAIVKVESNYNPKAKGRAGEIGLMQIKPATARGMGYKGAASGLYDPKTNLEWGMKYLAGAHKKAGGDLCGTVLRYNAGHFATRMNPVSRKYCTKVKQILAST